MSHADTVDTETAAPPVDRSGFAAVIGASTADAAVLREVQWMAKEAAEPLTVYIVGPTKPWLRTLAAPQADQIERLAKRLGARIVPVPPRESAARIISDWDAALPSHVFFSMPRFWPWDAGIGTKLVAEVEREARARNIAVGEDVAPLAETRPSLTWRLDQQRPWYHDYALSLFAVCIAALAVQWLKAFLPAESLSIVFLTAVIFSATAYGFAAALFASVISVAIFDFFFIAPTFSSSVSSPDNVLLVILFVLVSGITSNLAGRLRDQAEAAQRRESEARALFQLTRDVATSDTPPETYRAVTRQSASLFDAEAILFAPHKKSADGDPAALQPVSPNNPGLSQDDIEAARWAYSHNTPCGRGTDKFSTLEVQFRPLETANGVVGVLGFRTPRAQVAEDAAASRLLDSVCRMSAVAVERAQQSQELEDTRVISQTESLRSALLSSISHDFGTPLATIIGSSSSLLTYGKKYAPEVAEDLLTTILEEAERLNKFVNNLLQMTRLESGALIPRLQLAGVDDLIGTVLDDAHRRLEGYEVYMDVAERLPLVDIDFVLMETVLMNLIENACKYSPAESTISVRAYADRESVVIEIADQGQGIPSEDLGAVFDKFFRVKARDRKIAGTGLGLAICKGILEGHGGSIEALSEGPGKGTVMRVKLPVASEKAEVA